MSTNDTVLLLANGAAAMSVSTAVKDIDEESDMAASDAFKHELTYFAIEVAELMVRDGEGMTKFVTVTVKVRVFISPFS